MAEKSKVYVVAYHMYDPGDGTDELSVDGVFKKKDDAMKSAFRYVVDEVDSRRQDVIDEADDDDEKKRIENLSARDFAEEFFDSFDQSENSLSFTTGSYTRDFSITEMEIQ